MDESYEYRTPVAQREYSKKYYAANRETCKRRAKDYYRANRERVKANMRRWQLANRDKYIEYQREYRVKLAEARKLVYEGIPSVEF